MTRAQSFTVQYFRHLLIGIAIVTATTNTFAQIDPTTGCATGTLNAGNQTITCNSPNTVVTQAITTPQSISAATYDNINITVVSGTTIQLVGSPIGLAANSTINNYGTLNAINNFTYGYGISIGANSRSQTGGGTINNYGTIYTTGAGAAGIRIEASLAGSTSNTITNSGTITTIGNITGSTEANGITLKSGSTSTSVSNTVSNSGTITTSGIQARGIYVETVKSAVSITNTGTIRTTGSGASGIGTSNTFNTATITNSGSIAASGASAHGMYIAGSANISNSGTLCAGTITAGVCNPSGGGYGIGIENNTNTNRSSITNTSTGVISSSTTGIWSSQQPGVDVYNSGTISGLTNAINFVSSSSGGSTNSVTLYANSITTGAINFNTGNTQETLSFDGLINTNFNNAITGLNVINAVNGAKIVMNNSNGYALVSGVVKVDGSSSLTISSIISDQLSPTAVTSSLNKTGSGTLTLSGSNTYTGGTTLSAGTIAVSNDQALGTGRLSMTDSTTLQAAASVSLANNINLSGMSNIDTQENATSLTGLISGTGGVNKLGAGALTITNANTYTGNTNLLTGTVVLTGSIASNTTTNPNTTLQGGGVINGNLFNQGTLQPSYNGIKTNFTVTGNYSSTTGVFATNLYAPDTNLTADTLTINGAGYSGTGTTRIALSNTQLLGKPTSGDGVLLVNTTNGATTATNAFYYPGRLAAGAYEYRIVQGGSAAPGNWYLKADNAAVIQQVAAYGNQPGTNSTATMIPLNSALFLSEPVTPNSTERLEVANYPAMVSLARLYSMNTVDSLDQRRGDLMQTSKSNVNFPDSNAWARIIGKGEELRSTDRNQGPGLNARTYAAQFGFDAWRTVHADESKTFAGPFMTIGQANGNTYSSNGSFHTGDVQLQGMSLGLSATHVLQNGVYIDGIVQATRFTGSRANSILGTSINTTGWGLTGSLESGVKIKTSEHVSLTPQAQLIVNSNQFANSEDLYSQVAIPRDTSLVGRIGVKASYETSTQAGLDTSTWLRVSGLSNIAGKNGQMNFQSPYTNDVAGFNAQAPAAWLAIDAGLNVKISKDSQLSLSLGYDSSLSNSYQGAYGRVGLQIEF